MPTVVVPGHLLIAMTLPGLSIEVITMWFHFLGLTLAVTATFIQVLHILELLSIFKHYPQEDSCGLDGWIRKTKNRGISTN